VRSARTALLTSSVGVLAAAALLVPLPVLELSPGPAVDVPPLVHIAGPTHRVSGRLLLLTVTLSDPSLLQTVRAWLDPHRELVPRQAVIPPGVDGEQYQQAEQAVFDESARVAAAVAFRAAGLPAHVSGGGAQVAGVIRGGPSAGKLEVGDVITAVDGHPTPLAADVVTTTANTTAGQQVRLTITRGGSPRIIVVTLRPVGPLGRAGLGVAIRTVEPTIDLPVAVSVNQGDIGGPSAGLMMALSIYDLVGPVDLARGRVVAGTGTIDTAGHVGPIGGIAEKVVAAEHAGASVFLAPTSQAAAARAAANPGLRVVPVGTFDDAVRALQ